jgi:serine/threonine protein kinase
VNRLIGQLNAALSGRYAIQRELGSGGMATVFLADDLRHRRRVAIKVLHGDLGAAIGRERFLREIEIAAGLHHAHILPVYDSGIAVDLLYFVMPYAEGESLRQRLDREKQLPLDDALEIAREVADALDYAHRHGVVHRDIKPENILLQDGHAVVADFGIARAVVAAGDRKLTTTGVVIGTPAYMSPEQGVGGQELDGRSDLYALGCVVYEMLAGQPPFTGPTAESLAHQHLNVPARPVTDLRPAVPAKIVRAIQRALAKTPADRFTSAARFAEALKGPLEVTPPFVGGIAVALLSLVLAAAGLGIWARWDSISRHFGWRESSHANPKEWIIVAAFDGPSDEPELAATTRDLISAGLDQSTSFTVVPPEQIRTALRLARMPAETRVDAALARQLAYRKGIRAVVEGSISHMGEGHTIVVRVLDVERDSVILSENEVAPSQKALIPTISRVTRRIREGLGERRDAIRRTRLVEEGMTASFEAFKHRQRGIQLLLSGDSDGAILEGRAALALDPDFAAASALLGFAFFNLGQVDSALAAYRFALSRPERLSDEGRLQTEAAAAELSGNISLSMATLDRLVDLEPTSIGGQANRGWLLYRTGQYEAALGSTARAAAVGPFGPTQILILNRFSMLLALGRVDEARTAAAGLNEKFAQTAAVWIAAASGNWALTDSLGTALGASPTASLEMRRLGAMAVASAAAARGEVKAADGALRQAQGWAAASIPGARASVQAAHRARLLLALISGGAVSDLEDAWPRDSSISALVTRGLLAATAGDTQGARRFAAEVRSRPATELARAGADPVLLDGWIAAQEQRWEEVLRVLGPAARQGSEVGFGEDRAGRVTLRWLLARSFESLGRPDSAAYSFEMVLSPLGRVDQEYFTRGIAFAFAHARLVLLYTRLGRLDDARRHWRILSETAAHPDPAVQPLIAEAHAALASAEGVARSARR